VLVQKPLTTPPPLVVACQHRPPTPGVVP